MKKVFVLCLFLGALLILSACNPRLSPAVAAPSNTNSPAATTQAVDQNSSTNLVRSDNQGAVTIDVQPVNLSNPGDTLEFDVSMNTHSVNLNMDIATLATLTTDNGNTAQGEAWDGGAGGHHVSGMLSFPASVNGKSILDGASTLTLTIKNIDAPERVFTWSLSK